MCNFTHQFDGYCEKHYIGRKTNMKTTLLSLFLLMNLIATSQELGYDDQTKKYTEQDVVEIDSLSKSELYSKALEWISLNYKSAKDVIQLSNEEMGKIIVKGSFPTDLFFKKGWIRHTMVLQFKDGKFRYRFTNFSYFSPGSGEMPLEGSMFSKKKVLAEAKYNVDVCVVSIKKHMKTQTVEDDW